MKTTQPRPLSARRYGRPAVPKPRSARLVCWANAAEARSVVEEARRRGVSVSEHLRNLLGFETMRKVR